MKQTQNVIYSGFVGDWPAVRLSTKLSDTAPLKAAEFKPDRKETPTEDSAHDLQGALWATDEL